MTKKKVSIREEKIIIPTYERGPDDLYPPLLTRTATWIYPYPSQDNISGSEKSDKTYKAVILENRYLKMVILPELNGRIYSVVNKTNNRQMFYFNDVMKYSRVALRGAWVSGGVEFNFPHGHTVTTVSPVNYTLLEKPDGAAGVIISDMEKVSRMKWAVGITLYPDRSYYEMEVKLFNRTDVEHPYWFWHNAGVLATPGWRFISPSRKVFINKVGCIPFPKYKNKDISWIRRQPDPIDFFSVELNEDFFGCYHYDLGTGVIQVADRNEVQGRKMFTWGYKNYMKLWEGILTDKGGPHGEIQSGRFATQMVRQMLPAHSQVSWKEWWWPCRDLNGFVYANKDIALNVEHLKNGVEVALNSTREFKEAILSIKKGDKELEKIPVDVAPDRPFRKILPRLSSRLLNDSIFFFFDSRGGCLASYRFIPELSKERSKSSSFSSNCYTMPMPVLKKGITVQECLNRADTLERQDARREAENEYKRALSLSPLSSEVNFALGRFLLRRGRFTEALKYLRSALSFSPFSIKILYHLALALRYQGNLDEAKNLFVQTRLIDPSFSHLAAYGLGEIALKEGNLSMAEAYLRESLLHSPTDIRATTLLSVILRKAGKLAEAEKLVSLLLEENPTEEWARVEQYFILRETGRSGTAKVIPTRDLLFDDQAVMEIAGDYLKVGLVSEALEILEGAGDSRWPILYYWIGYCRYCLGDRQGAGSAFKKGSRLNMDYVFPHRPESLGILELALKLQPGDAKIEACLGHLLCSMGEEERAAVYWKRAVKHNPSDSVSWGSLALYLWKVKQKKEEARKAYEKAVKLEPHTWRLLVERDMLLAEMGRHEKRVALLKKIPEDIASFDRVALRLADAFLFTQRLNECIGFLKRSFIRPWESETIGRDIYSRALISRGLSKMRFGNYTEAIKDLKESIKFPRNMGSAEPSRYRGCAKNYYFLGIALIKSGQRQKALKFWNKGVREIEMKNSESYFYQTLCYLKLGKTALAKKRLNSLKEFCLKDIAEALVPAAEPHYLFSLIYALEGEKTKSRREALRALEISPSYYEAKIWFSYQQLKGEFSKLENKNA